MSVLMPVQGIEKECLCFSFACRLYCWVKFGGSVDWAFIRFEQKRKAGEKMAEEIQIYLQ